MHRSAPPFGAHLVWAVMSFVTACAHGARHHDDTHCSTAEERIATDPRFEALSRPFRTKQPLVLRADVRFECGRSSTCLAPEDRWVELTIDSRHASEMCAAEVGSLLQMEGFALSPEQLEGGVYAWQARAQLRSEHGSIDATMHDMMLALTGDGSAVLFVRESAPRNVPTATHTQYEQTLALRIRGGTLSGEVWLRAQAVQWPKPGEWVLRSTSLYRAYIGRATHGIDSERAR